MGFRAKKEPVWVYEIVPLLREDSKKQVSGGMNAIFKVTDFDENSSILKIPLSKRLKAKNHFNKDDTYIFQEDRALKLLSDVEGVVNSNSFQSFLSYKSGKTFSGLHLNYLDGCTLDEFECDSSSQLYYLRDVAGILSQVHDKGVVHLDVKPQNIMICDSGVYLFDFEAAKINNHSMFNSFRLFTPAYSANEVILSSEDSEIYESLDGRSDVFSLGKTLYSLLCIDEVERFNNKVFFENKFPDTYFSILHESMKKQLPKELANLAIGATEQNMCDRPRMNEVYRTLDKLVNLDLK